MNTTISKVTCVGAGLIGAGWAAHFMRAGLDVTVYDVSAERGAPDGCQITRAAY
ncbi:hypothetical protein CO676_33435 [Sinorhizobium sp. BJ1]|nr:hypothetical protein CO676_33435 [Sinorhizobium sp. BJ1]